MIKGGQSGECRFRSQAYSSRAAAAAKAPAPIPTVALTAPFSVC